ncbi:Cell death protease [Mortierella alpina]|uniref:Carboxypeptidase n=1 Tax=Mortierella alpina TaxID=64518 RepID=A0A9P6M5D9_MORAP|nr:Cell death protease [Mortierella alpina]
MVGGVADDYLVKGLPELSPADSAQLRQHAGHIAVDGAGESNLFFWLVANKQVQKKSKLIIWLNGARIKISSADGYFLESGPLRFVDQKLTINKGGWHEFANVLFLDQPVGTGLSYSTEPLLGTLKEITDHFLGFLKAFFAIFPDRAQDELYLAGESYAGTYIPYFARGVLDHNEHVAAEDIAYKLQGIVIGNGWIDPLHQYTSFIPYVEQHGLSTPQLMEEMVAQQQICLDAIRLHDRITQDACEQIVQLVMQHSVNAGQKNPRCINQYDVRLTDDFPACGLNWPYELPQMATYLRREDVLKALHATGAATPWTECSSHVSQALRNDDSAPAVGLLPGILEKAKDTPKIGWTVQDQSAGVWKQARNLTYVVLHNASHMVPYDQPYAALDMMNRFMELDPKMQSFSSKLDTDVQEDEEVPPGGQKVDIDQPKGSYFSSKGSAVLLFVMMAVGVGAFIVIRNNRRQKKRGSDHDGVQWFPLGSNTSGGRRGVLNHEDELDELVVEGGIQDSDEDDEHDDDERIIARP